MKPFRGTIANDLLVLFASLDSWLCKANLFEARTCSNDKNAAGSRCG